MGQVDGRAISVETLRSKTQYASYRRHKGRIVLDIQPEVSSLD